MNAPVQGLRAPLFDMLKSADPATEPAADLIDFSSLFGTLWRGRLQLLATCALAAALGGGWAGFVAEPQYRATAALVMAPPETVAPTGLDSVMPGLSGDSVAVNTEVEILKSRALLRRLATELQLTRDPEFNAALAPPSALEQQLAALAERVDLPLPAPATPPALPATLETLEERITVRNVPDSRVFEVTAESRVPGKAAEIANALARIYLGDQIALKQREAERATDWLSARVSELRVELEAADSRAKAFAADMELVDAEQLQALAAQLKEIRQRIAARRTDLAASGATGDRARAQIAPLQDMEAELSARLARQSQDLVRLGQLQLEAEASRMIYEHFLSRLKEASVQRGIQKADSRILSAAEIPVEPARPQPLLTTVLAGFLGLVLGAGILLTREARADGFRTADALERAAGRQVLGQIPRTRRRGPHCLVDRILQSPASFAAESVRHLRTAIALSGPAWPQVILITSSVPGEGKSNLSLALGHNLAALGKRVLVIEADIRRRALGGWFGKREKRGLLAVLEGRMTLEEAVRPADRLGIDVLPGETSRAEAADLLAAQNVDGLLAAARERYDCILIDTPPVLAVPDARLLGRAADMILYVVAWDRTSRAQLREGLRALETVQLPVGGLVLSRIDSRGMKRYGHRGFGAYGADGYYEA